MKRFTLNKSITAFGLSSMLVLGAAACGDADEVLDNAADAAGDVATDAADAAGDAAEATADAAGDAADATAEAATDAADAATDTAEEMVEDDAMEDDTMEEDDAMEDDAMVDALNPADVSVEDLTSGLEIAGIADAGTVAQTIKDNAPFADVDALRAALPDVDDATFELIQKVISIG